MTSDPYRSRFRSLREGRRASVLATVLAGSLVAPVAQTAEPAPAEKRVVQDLGPLEQTNGEVPPADLEKARKWLEKIYGQPVFEQGADEEEGGEEEESDPDAPAATSKTQPDGQKAKDKDLKAVAPGTRTADALPTADRSGVTGKTISVPKGEGTIKGMEESFSAQLSTGIATFSVPFSIPAARGAAQPSLGLSYSSGGGLGLAGMGWSVGVPFIARQTDRGTPQYNDSGAWPERDRFVFNGGQELVPVCVVDSSLGCPGTIQGSEESGPGEFMPHWSAGHRYFRPRVEGSFLRFFLSVDGRTWRVQSQSGVTMELGVPLDGTNDETALEANPDKKDQIYRWHLVRQYDMAGTPHPASGNPTPNNATRYRYQRVPGEGNAVYLTDIFHTSPSATPTTLDDALFAHHVRLRYQDRPDPTHSYRSGWRIDQARRLVGVDVASKPFSGSTTANREMLRRYHLAYDPTAHVSLLTSVTVEGRCADTGQSQIKEGSDQGLPASTSCPTLPPMRFDYSHVEGHLPGGTVSGSTLDGYEPFDERVHSVTNSPAHSLDEEQTVLHDVDSDGLPDVLVTAPGLFGGKHGVFFNGSSGTAAKFAASTIGVQGVLGANAGTITLGNFNVVPLDVDGDATADLVHMPLVKKYAIYTPKKIGTAWWWQGREVETADALNPKIDFGRDASFTKVVDVNFDGLVDVVRTTGTELQTYFSLGRYPKGDGRFGQGTWTGKDTATLTTEPVRMCLPWSGTSVSFDDKDTQLADMNGDGIVDIVRIRRGDIQYWPGRGNGFWGTGARDNCPGGTFGQGRGVRMDESPYYSDIQGDSLRVEDVNGDGLSDLVQVRFQDVDIWLNVDGQGWTQQHTLRGTPASPSYANRVRLTDVNGSGTPDILWGDAGRYKFIDLAGGERPWLLTRVENGLGKSTDLEYDSSVAEMLAAQTAGKAWPKGMPTVTHVVKRVTVKSNLVVAGQTTSDVTEYTYAEPYYDGLQREFRGFARATSRRVGDANSPAETTESRFLLGECVDETPGSSVLECTPGERWRDNPREALKGLPYVVERSDASGVYHSTAITGYELRPLYAGLDGREARHAFVAGAYPILYDTAAFVASPGNTGMGLFVQAPGVDVEIEFPIRSANLTVAGLTASTVDSFGNTQMATAYGCYGGTDCSGWIEEPLTQETRVRQVSPGSEPSAWLFRTTRKSLVGDPARHSQTYNLTTHSYDDRGYLTSDVAHLSGSVELVRGVPPAASPGDPTYFPPRSGGVGSSTSFTSGTYQYDALGNVTQHAGTNLRCRALEYDSEYKQLPKKETVYTGKGLHGSSAAVEAGCGGTNPSLFTEVIAYDRGLGVATEVKDVTGQPTRIVYDGLGRIKELFKPSATLVGQPSTGASVLVDYTLPGPGGPAYSVIHTRTQDGLNDATGAYLEAWSYVDGLGRTFATLKEGDTEGSAIVSLVDFDTKSAVRRTLLEHVQPQASFNFKDAPPFGYRTQSYDAFGRPTRTWDLEGTETLRNYYHALTVDRWDAEDLNLDSGAQHYGTFATEYRDGHGRVRMTKERFRSNGTTEDARITETRYIPTGAPEMILTWLDSLWLYPITRYMVYDTLGRLVLNVEPNSSPGYAHNWNPNQPSDNQTTYAGVRAWRYRYNDAGDMVGVSDSRQCGANYFYDGLGRLLMEDYFRCEAHHVAYTTPSFTGNPSLPNTGVEVAYEYDALSVTPAKPPGWAPTANFLKGRLARVRDLGAHDLLWYDGRGRVVQNARQIARAGATPVSAMASRFSVRWYKQANEYDAADRPMSESTGATVANLLGANSESKVFTTYSSRGTVDSVLSSYGTLVSNIQRDPDGFVRAITYGDTAATKTSFEPDERRRIREVTTFRAAPAHWPVEWYNDTTGVYQETLEAQEFTYDDVSNPIAITDLRDPAGWPAGSKPGSRSVQYDDFYRAKQIDHTYAGAGGNDPWTSPHDAEVDAFTSDPADPQSDVDSRRALPSPHVSFPNRVRQQKYRYDWNGNSVGTSDDADGFYDRSLGDEVAHGWGNGIVHGTQNDGPYQLRSATRLIGPNKGKLAALYDVAGNMTRLTVDRDGTCLVTAPRTAPVPGCSQVYLYEWDELNRLTRARRWDHANIPNINSPPSVTAGTYALDLRYRYDSSGNRVHKWAKTADTAATHAQDDAYTAYVFASLEIRRTRYGTPTANEFELTASSEVPYLLANGVRLARVVYEPDAPESNPNDQYVFFELGDHLGSTSTVLDMATSELVQKSSFMAYGGAESDLRPDRWDNFREDYRFTGKEEDVEVGLVYFGKRFYNPLLGRWCNPDPLALHSAGSADLNLYAYVGGQSLRAIDPRGLTPKEWLQGFGAGALDAGRALVAGGKAVAGKVASETKVVATLVEKGEFREAAAHTATTAAAGSWAVMKGTYDTVKSFPSRVGDAVTAPGDYDSGRKAFAPVAELATAVTGAYAGVRAGLTRATATSALTEATELADFAQSVRPRPGAAAALTVGDRTFGALSGGEMSLEPRVRAALDALSPAERSLYHGRCAEMSCLSQALEAGVNPAGGEMAAVNVRKVGNPEHGMLKPPCASCEKVMDQFEVQAVKSGD